jgi:hypothetical protein
MFTASSALADDLTMRVCGRIPAITSGNRRTMTHATPTEPAPTEKLAPLSPAERMRHSRERRKNGFFCLTLEIRQSEVDAFVRCGRIRPEERASPAAIREAVYSLLKNLVVSMTPYPATRRPGTRPHGGAA